MTMEGNNQMSSQSQMQNQQGITCPNCGRIYNIFNKNQLGKMLKD